MDARHKISKKRSLFQRRDLRLKLSRNQQAQQGPKFPSRRPPPQGRRKPFNRDNKRFQNFRRHPAVQNGTINTSMQDNFTVQNHHPSTTQFLPDISMAQNHNSTQFHQNNDFESEFSQSSRLDPSFENVASRNASSSELNVWSVLITNLKRQVTAANIMEIFRKVGPVSDCQLLHPGAVIVTFFTQHNAKAAKEMYHNCPYEGVPMQCSLLPGGVTK